MFICSFFRIPLYRKPIINKKGCAKPKKKRKKYTRLLKTAIPVEKREEKIRTKGDEVTCFRESTQPLNEISLSTPLSICKTLQAV